MLEENDYMDYLNQIYEKFDLIFMQEYINAAPVQYNLSIEQIDDICKLCDEYENVDEELGTYRTILMKLKPYKNHDKLLEKFNNFKTLHDNKSQKSIV